jgi:hypothetical protein
MMGSVHWEPINVATTPALIPITCVMVPVIVLMVMMKLAVAVVVQWTKIWSVDSAASYQTVYVILCIFNAPVGAACPYC